MSPAYNATRRKACIHGSSGQDPARTIAPPLARHVDPATAANETGKPTSDLRIDLSVHKSSDHIKSLRRTLAKDRSTLTALDQDQFTRVNSDSFAPPQSVTASAGTRSTPVGQ